jgi:hypothetical protein
MRTPGRITAAWLVSILGPRPHVIAPALYEFNKPPRRKPKQSTVNLRMALNDFDKVRQLLLAGEGQLPRGQRRELVDALAERWGIESGAILAVLEGRRRDPRLPPPPAETPTN